MFFKIVQNVLKNFSIFTGKHKSLFNKVAGPVNIAKFLRKPFFIKYLLQ